MLSSLQSWTEAAGFPTWIASCQPVGTSLFGIHALCQESTPCKALRTWRMKQGASAHIQVAKADATDVMSLLADLTKATDELNRERYAMEDIMCQMSAAGLLDSACASSSSSSSSDCGDPSPTSVPSESAMRSVLTMQQGTVAVCQGKACTRRGASADIHSALQRHFTDSGAQVDVQCTKCLGACKTATNIRVEPTPGDGDVRIVNAVCLDDLVVQQPAARGPLMQACT